MPEGLDIEHEKSLHGTAPLYHEQILISTGKADWTSRIEDDTHGRLAKELKTLLGLKGKYFDPYRNILLTCSSNPGPDAEGPQRLASSLTSSEHTITPSTSVCLFPSFLFIPSINEDQSGATALVSTLGDPQQEPAKMGLTAHALGGRNIDHITILICSHGTRDSRCGILGPILQSEFMKQMKRAGIRVFETFESVGSDKSPSENGATVNLISHVGGHRWAGNVIIYIPPSWKHHPLAGTGIWYGRVAPSHVEGIVNSTVVRGDIISELFRGGLHANRSPMRLPDELK